MDERVTSVLRDLRSRLEVEMPEKVEKIVLFGSVARGEDTEDSDLDVLVLLRDPVVYAERAAVMNALADIALARGLVPAPVVLTVAEWADMHRRELLFADEVDRDGITL